ncbi:hypothetical protein B6N60_01638 [Richelia sinica FACHB-800]|uniref:Uncharacterized protein n=1 Tax=Richelia sinica FACHB-800 TaxID=1357546 RepID=A0A975Y496_9NOST|nr:hypothetical protein B6N60_01638 [Richelia sinica FACHB-800]
MCGDIKIFGIRKCEEKATLVDMVIFSEEDYQQRDE